MAWSGMNGDQILESRRNDATSEWEKKILQLRQWMKDQGFGDLHARQITVTLRSFFAFHRVKLNPTPQEASKLRKAHRKTEDFKFSREDLRKMADIANISEQYVVVVGKSFGFRAGDFLRLTRGHFTVLNLERPAPIFLGEYATVKEDVTAYPFIDSDAVPVVKAMLQKMTVEGLTSPNDKMLTYKHELELSRVLKRLIRRAGIDTGNKVVRFHCLRKFLIDHLSSHMSESKWKQIVGKSISEGAYVTAENLRADYARAMAETTFTKQTSKDEVELLAAQKATELTINLLNIPLETKAAMIRKIYSVKKVLDLKPLEIEIAVLQKQQRAEAGGLNFEQMAARSIARMFKMAIRELKEMNNERSEQT